MSEPIQYYSTNGKAPLVSFPEALLAGLAPDKGLYMPSHFPKLSDGELDDMGGMGYPAIAQMVLGKYLTPYLREKELRSLCKDAYNFKVPLEKVVNRQYVMRLDQGPTASFKDFAARMMGRLMNYFLARDNKHLIILTATSGDTGSAVANAFYGLDSIDVVVLFPKTEVTEVQRRQMTTLKKNIHVIALDGKFDDCQALVKEAFVDPALSVLPLSSANSINIGRLLPQSIFYFFAWASLRNSPEEKPIFSVPSGNFGNLMGGLIAKNMGLPVERFIISTNANKEVPDFLETGEYKLISPSLDCISSAMNVGHPSNLSRIIDLYGGAMDEKGIISRQPGKQRMIEDLWGTSVTDSETIACLRNAWLSHQLLLEPHGAVAWEGLKRYLNLEKSNPDILAISLETANPAKFPEKIKEVLGMEPALPVSLSGLLEKSEEMVSMGSGYSEFKQYLTDSFT
jgi:threonine synthase